MLLLSLLAFGCLCILLSISTCSVFVLCVKLPGQKKRKKPSTEFETSEEIPPASLIDLPGEFVYTSGSVDQAIEEYNARQRRSVVGDNTPSRTIVETTPPTLPCDKDLIGQYNVNHRAFFLVKINTTVSTALNLSRETSLLQWLWKSPHDPKQTQSKLRKDINQKEDTEPYENAKELILKQYPTLPVSYPQYAFLPYANTWNGLHYTDISALYIDSSIPGPLSRKKLVRLLTARNVLFVDCRSEYEHRESTPGYYIDTLNDPVEGDVTSLRLSKSSDIVKLLCRKDGTDVVPSSSLKTSQNVNIAASAPIPSTTPKEFIDAKDDYVPRFPNKFIVFYCEESSKRGPAMKRLYDKITKTHNTYKLEGGYRQYILTMFNKKTNNEEKIEEEGYREALETFYARKTYYRVFLQWDAVTPEARQLLNYAAEEYSPDSLVIETQNPKPLQSKTQAEDYEKELNEALTVPQSVYTGVSKKLFG